MKELKTLCTRHLQFGWWSLTCFVVLGITLEACHGLKVSWYLGREAESRRLLWTLAHAHGTLLALVHVALAGTCLMLPSPVTRRRRWASALLMAASVLLPGGFFLGGLHAYDGDPGLGIWLVPLGAFCLFTAVIFTALETLLPLPTDVTDGGERGS